MQVAIFQMADLFFDNILPPPPLSFPTPCPSPGGVGDRHLLNPKFSVVAHCAVVCTVVVRFPRGGWGTVTW